VGGGGSSGGTGGTGGGTGGTGGGTTTGGTTTGGGTTTIEPGLQAQLAQLYPDGNVTSDDDWSFLLTYYDEETLNAAGFHHDAQADAATPGGTPNYNPTDAELQNADIDMESVLALGYGPISEARLSELVDSGEVIMYVQDGKIRFRRATPAPTPWAPGAAFGV
jgi:hypothetical protein